MAPKDRPASTPRHEVRTRWDVRIPVRDGLELSANLWLPVPTADRPDERFPVVLEMIPYGKDSWRRNGDVMRGTWLARRGYALCRLDVRGTGSSPGVAIDEYAAAETLDGYDAVEWLAGQPWCDGNVAMWGISYGGFTAIQVAKLRPPHLRAIVPVYATDDRYLDDVHYRGGCLTGSELSQYAVSQVAMNAMPPDPAFRGPGWREEWRERLERTPVWLFEWLRQQTDGPYWRQGSLAPDYEALDVAVYQVGGWNDSYVDPVFRMQERCTNAAIRSLVGPWGHSWPDDATPGPNVDWLHEVVRFLDRYLRGQANGLEDEPPLVWFERDFAPPEPFPARWPGRWRAADRFPHPATATQAWVLSGGTAPGDGRLSPPGADPAAADGGADTVHPGPDRLPHRATVGTTGALSWGAGGEPNGLGRDPRPDEARSLTYTSRPLDAPLAILGFPEVVLNVAVDAPVATVVCRLMDVAPDGVSSQVALGALNLTHRRSHVDPEPLVPGRVEEVRVALRAAGYRYAAGHRIRLVVASQYWPVLWPSPYPAVLEVHRDDARPSLLELPTIPQAGGAGERAVPAFGTTPPDDLVPVGGGDDEPASWRVIEDVLAGTVSVETSEGGTSTLPDGRSLFTRETFRLAARDADPAHAEMHADVVYRWHEVGFQTEIRAAARMTSDPDAFELEVDLAVDLDGEPFFAGRTSERVPRRLV
ncbi:MAG TPA: CocE/NonD family hydrolase [Candidatus Limnocylindrales bacterium]|nr:CocE/NonD family hydrolase [Candidatus Limnocylindrales bacterium]